MIKRLALLILLACSFGFAQTTTFTANLKDLATNIPATPEAGPVYIELTLKNCAGSGTNPTLPHVNGVGIVTFPVNLYPTAGVVTATVYDETFIVCGSSTGVGYYHIRIYQGDNTRSLVKKLVFEDDFDIQGASFSLNSATPRSGAVITPPPATAVLTNPAGNQTVVQPVGTSLSVNRFSAAFAQSANGTNEIAGSRFTDTSPTGNFLDFTNATGATHLWEVDVTGTLLAGIIPSARINNTVTPATQTKITYNGQGLVTAGVQAAASDLSNGTTGTGKIGLQAVNPVTFSATPTFDCSLGSVQKLTLTANVTSSSLSNCQAGQIVTFEICQDATGGRTFVNPAGLNQWSTIPSSANACGSQQYAFDTTTTAFPDMMPALTGDVTSSATSTATTVAKIQGTTVTGTTGTVAAVLSTSPTLVTPNIGVATATTVQGMTGQLTPNAAGGIDVGTSALPFSGVRIGGAATNNIRVTGTATAGRTATLQDVTDTFVMRATTDSLTNKALIGAASGNTVTLIDSQDTLGNVTNNGSDQVLYTKTITANTIGAGKGFRVTAHAVSNNAVAVTYKIKIGATTVSITNGGASGVTARWVVEVKNNAGVQNAQTLNSFLVEGATILNTGNAAPAENFVNAITVSLSSNAASGTVTPKTWLVEAIQ